MALFSRPTRSEIPTVDVETAAARGPGAVLLDVREDDEWAAGHALGATHVPLCRLDPRDLAGAGPVFVICRSGNRSAMATEALRSAGVDAHNVAGGIGAWSRAGLPLELG